jgi:hypothetical protein
MNNILQKCYEECPAHAFAPNCRFRHGDKLPMSTDAAALVRETADAIVLLRRTDQERPEGRPARV